MKKIWSSELRIRTDVVFQLPLFVDTHVIAGLGGVGGDDGLGVGGSCEEVTLSDGVAVPHVGIGGDNGLRGGAGGSGGKA